MTTTFADIKFRQIRVTREPFSEPLHRDVVKSQCALTPDVTQFDDDFDLWISAARRQLEEDAQVALVAQQCELSLDQFPRGILETPRYGSDVQVIEIRKCPVWSIDSVEYTDGNGDLQTLSSNDYLADLTSFPARIRPLWGNAWPYAREVPRSIRITFTAGYAAPFTADAGTDVLTAQGRAFADDDVVRVQNSGGALPSGLAAATDYYAVSAASSGSGSTLSLSASSGGGAIDITDTGSGLNLLGEVPQTALQAIRMLVAHWWRNRETVIVGTISKEIERSWQSLVMSLKYES